MKSILTTLDLINQPKPADVIAEDEVEEELTLEELEALEEDDELEEAWISVDDFDDRPASEYKLVSREEEKTDGGTLRKSEYEREDGEFTEKQIKMAFGILNDPRYKGGNLTDAIEAIEGIAPGLSEHPAVQRAMLATSESVEVEEGLVDADGNPVKSVTTKPRPKQEKLSVLDKAAKAPKTKLEPRIPKMEEVDEVNEGHLADLAQRAEMDHEVQMARSDLYKIANCAIKLHEMLKNVSEADGLEGWQQSKITKAADYMGSVFHAMDYDMQFGEQAESKKPISNMKEVNEIKRLSGQQLDEAFSRKHYELFASMLQEITDLNTRMDFADRLVSLFRQDNPRFNDELFLKAAGLAD